MLWSIALCLLALNPPARAEIDLRCRAFAPGEPVLVHCRAGEPLLSCEGEALGVPLPLSLSGDRRSAWGLFGIDLETDPGEGRVSIRCTTAEESPIRMERTFRIEQAAYPTQHLKVYPEYVEPPAEVQERIARERARLDVLFSGVSPAGAVPPGFSAPLAGTGRNFGSRRIFNGMPRAPHNGVDLRAAAGTPVRAGAAGRVVLAEDLYFTGRTVLLDHGGGLFTLYAHLSRIGVKEGDAVGRGQRIGSVGATGRATGPHLHWGARLRGARVNPVSLVKLLPPPPPESADGKGPPPPARR